MEKTTDENKKSEESFENWTSTAGEFWGNMAKVWEESSKIGGNSNGTAQKALDKTFATWKKGIDSFESLSESFMEKEFKHLYSENEDSQKSQALLRIMRSFSSRFFEFQRDSLNFASKIGDSVEGLNFSQLDKESFNKWADLYNNEISKVFNIPQIGLGREYQERLIRALDKFNIFQASVLEFLYFLYLPMEKTFKLMQKELIKKVNEGNVPNDHTGFYQSWLKKLEQHYVVMFQSGEYTKVLGRLLHAMGEFHQAKNDLVEDFVKTLPIPTKTEMDELYKEIYSLKKRIRLLEKKK